MSSFPRLHKLRLKRHLDERTDGVHLSYDRMASFLAPYGNRDALDVARDLDSKAEDLLRNVAR